jgi:NAD(P)-dependent dehydrogenase (short-subunit alcohol dehydrogenase family)
MTDGAFSKLDLSGKSVLVTGGGSGIGRASAILMGARGAFVTVADLDGESAEATASAIRDGGGNASSVTTDIRDEAQVAAMVNAAVEFGGGLHGAFNNAGITRPGTLLQTDLELWNDLFATNATGPFLCAKYEIIYMLEHGGGSIVNTASGAGNRGIPGQAAYVASKHAVVGITRSISVEYAARGIRANTLLPGVTNTPLAAEAMKDPVTAKGLANARPMGRIAEPEELAEQVAWLISDASSHSTGALFFVDGGTSGA